jgi:hypothetical protein
VHALRFIAPGELGGIVPGIPAAWAADPVARAIRSAGDDLQPVWPYAAGTVRGGAQADEIALTGAACTAWSTRARRLTQTRP